MGSWCASELFPTNLRVIIVYYRTNELIQYLPLLFFHIAKGSQDQIVRCNSIAQGHTHDSLIFLKILDLCAQLDNLSISVL